MSQYVRYVLFQEIITQRECTESEYLFISKSSTSKEVSKPMKLLSKVACSSRFGGCHVGDLLVAW